MRKRLISMLMVVCMCFGSSTMAFAAEVDPNSTDATTVQATQQHNEDDVMLLGGVETWSKKSATVGTFTMEGNNLTPVKTMGRDGELVINVKFESNPSAILLVQIVNADTQKVRASWTTPACYMHDGLVSPDGLHVKKGQRIQVFFKVLDKNGNYDDNRKLKLTYGYAFDFFS